MIILNDSTFKEAKVIDFEGRHKGKIFDEMNFLNKDFTKEINTHKLMIIDETPDDEFDDVTYMEKGFIVEFVGNTNSEILSDKFIGDKFFNWSHDLVVKATNERFDVEEGGELEDNLENPFELMNILCKEMYNLDSIELLGSTLDFGIRGALFVKFLLTEMELEDIKSIRLVPVQENFLHTFGNAINGY